MSTISTIFKKMRKNDKQRNSHFGEKGKGRAFLENRFAGQFSNDHCRRSGVRLAGSGKCVEMRVGRWIAFGDRFHAPGNTEK